MTLSKSG